MSDIAERLEHLDSFIQGDGCKSWGELIALGAEGAQEIKRLRATIAQLRAVAGTVSMDGPTFGAIKGSLPDVKGRVRHEVADHLSVGGTFTPVNEGPGRG